MIRSFATRFVVAIASIAAISYCSAISRAETLSPATTAGHWSAGAGQGLVGSFGAMGATESDGDVSAAVLRSLATSNEVVAYHSAVTTPSFGRQVVQKAPTMGFGFETVPFESFLSVAAAPNGENVIRTFIIIKTDKSDSDDSSLGKTSADELMNKFTRASVGATTTSGSATLSILQVPPASSSLVYTNVLLKDGVQAAE